MYLSLLKRLSNHPFFIKLFHWEYWPFDVVYAPIYIYWFWLSIKARSFFFFNTSNPKIKNGGFLLESKKEIYDLIPSKYYPKTLFFRAQCSSEVVLNQVQNGGINFPLIAKPDIGMRGMRVEKLNYSAELSNYVKNSKVDFLVQEFVPFTKEAGIFYYRYPNEKSGHISGIVGKEFLSVSGDGISTIEELLNQNKRYILQLTTLKRIYKEELKRVPGKDENVVLVPYGNHVRGAKFTDCTHLADEILTRVIDDVCKQIPGFYFGRLDIRYSTWEELKEGKNFSIIELNGAGSEPTHIYDPDHSIFFAWKEIIRHWRILNKISRMNHQKHKMPYMRISEGLQMFKQNKAYVKLLQN